MKLVRIDLTVTVPEGIAAKFVRQEVQAVINRRLGAALLGPRDPEREAVRAVRVMPRPKRRGVDGSTP